MYKIIGADQKEYGPVTAEQLRQWIAQGRTTGQTRTQMEGSTGWKPLSEFPEFADTLAAKAAAAAPPPKVNTAEGEKLAAEIIARDYRLDISDCFGRSWNLLKKNFWLLVGGSAIMFLISVGLDAFGGVGRLVTLVFGFALWGGLDLLFLKRLRGQSADIGTAFSSFSTAFVPLMLACLVAHVLTALGLLLCILPGIYLFVAWWMFTPLLVLDKGLDFWPAMECSRKVVTQHWWTCFALCLLTVIVWLAGLLACGLGMFITLPIAIGASVYAYEDIFGVRASAPTSVAAIPPQNSPSTMTTPPPGATPPTGETTPASA
jgi:hypothetical protein